jgi:hypothetical protein
VRTTAKGCWPKQTVLGSGSLEDLDSFCAPRIWVRAVPWEPPRRPRFNVTFMTRQDVERSPGTMSDISKARF